MTDWLQRATDAYNDSTDYVDANYRKAWEDNLRLFHGEHPIGSKYLSEAYKNRSRMFRPKTRAATTKIEAAVAAAFFSSQDVVSVEAENDASVYDAASAAINQELLQYRLTKTIPWFQTLVGGMQDAYIMGAVCSYHYWKYKEEKIVTRQPVLDPMTGQPVLNEYGEPLTTDVPGVNVLEDAPCIELIPLENFRFSPAASWTDPVESSPYIIYMFPMFICDIKENMTASDPKTGMPKWRKADDKTIQQAVQSGHDSTRMVRDGNRTDSADPVTVTDYSVAWVHLNIMRDGTHDKVFHTLGTQHLLSTPKPIKEVYFHGKRPFAFGCAKLEAHRAMPDSPIAIGKPLQMEINDVANQRLDNVKLVLNKRWKARRGGNVDTLSLNRNVPGSITMMDKLDDVEEINWPDVTASSYQEQDRLNVDHDDVMGTFSGGSVQSNRKLNETVGGMNLLTQGANQITEYTIRTFTETWVEKVLRQVLLLEQYYEDDQVVLALAGQKAQLWQRFGISQVTDELLQKELTVSVNVGIGATDPNTKVQKLLLGARTVAEIGNMPNQILNMQELSKEVFGYLGWKDGGRFLNQGQGMQDPRVAMAMQQIQQQAQLIQKEKMALDQQAMKSAQKEMDLKVLEANLRGLIQQAQAQLKQVGAEKQIVDAHKTAVIAEIRSEAAEAESEARENVMALVEQVGRGKQEDTKPQAPITVMIDGKDASLKGRKTHAQFRKVSDGVWDVVKEEVVQ